MQGFLTTLILCFALPLFAQKPSWGDAQTYQEASEQAQNQVMLKRPMNLNLFKEQTQPYREQTQALSRGVMRQLMQSQNQGAKKRPQVPSILVFASLGMPKASLQALMLQADRYQVPIIIRGVLPQGFKQTVLKIQSLLPKDTSGQQVGGVSINPTWFKRFKIVQVPAFVEVKAGVCQEQTPCTENDFDVLYGNVSLDDALQYLSEQGQHKYLAQQRLKDVQG